MDAAASGCGALNFASWTVANSEANAAFCARSTIGSRAIAAARSWRPTSPVSSTNIRMPRPKGASRLPFGLLRDATIQLPPPLQNAPHLPAGTRRRDGANASDFLWPAQACNRVNRERTATMLPQAMRRRAALAARFAGEASSSRIRSRAEGEFHPRAGTATGRSPGSASHLHALLGEIFQRARMPRDRRVLHRLVLEGDVLCLRVHDRELIALLD